MFLCVFIQQAMWVKIPNYLWHAYCRSSGVHWWGLCELWQCQVRRYFHCSCAHQEQLQCCNCLPGIHNTHVRMYVCMCISVLATALILKIVPTFWKLIGKSIRIWPELGWKTCKSMTSSSHQTVHGHHPLSWWKHFCTDICLEFVRWRTAIVSSGVLLYIICVQYCNS